MHPPYRREQNHWLIELALDDPLQLFNTIDPTPFPQKDLDPAAESFILDAVRDFHRGDALKLVVQLPRDCITPRLAERMIGAIGHYFSWRAVEEDRYRGRLLAEGRIALLVGLSFVFACTLVRSLLLSSGSGLPGEILGEGLMIIGWVALWRPVDIFLYGWWPLRRRAGLFRRISQIPVEVRVRTGDTA